MKDLMELYVGSRVAVYCLTGCWQGTLTSVNDETFTVDYEKPELRDGQPTGKTFKLRATVQLKNVEAFERLAMKE